MFTYIVTLGAIVGRVANSWDYESLSRVSTQSMANTTKVTSAVRRCKAENYICMVGTSSVGFCVVGVSAPLPGHG